MIIKIILVPLLLWTFCSVVTYGIIRHLDPTEVRGDEAFSACVLFFTWPLFLMLLVGQLVFTVLASLGEFVGGIIDSVLKSKGGRNKWED